MRKVRREPVTWAQGQSVSSWFQFNAEAPNGFSMPAVFTGTRMRVVAADPGADGLADPATLEVLRDFDGAAVSWAFVASSRVVFHPDALRFQGFLALQSIDAGGAPIVQASPRLGAWRFGAVS
jgi:hypothetical protein